MNRAAVVAPILLIAALAGMIYCAANRPFGEGGALAETKMIVNSIAAGSEAFQAEYGYWPRTKEDLLHNERGMTFVVLRQGWEWVDAWGHPIIYTPFDQEQGYGSVLSYGRDGRPGGQTQNADVEQRFGIRRANDRR